MRQMCICLSHSAFVCHTHICLSPPLICPRNCLSHPAFVCPTHTFHSSCDWCRYICMQPIGNVSWSISSSFNHFMSIIFVFSPSTPHHSVHRDNSVLCGPRTVKFGVMRSSLLHRNNSVLCGPRTVKF